MYIHLCKYIQIYMYTYIHTCMYIQITYMYTSHIYERRYKYMQIRVHIDMNMHIYIHIYIYVCVYTYMQICIYMHTSKRADRYVFICNMTYSFQSTLERFN